MSSVHVLKAGFQRGEITPLAHGSVETDHYALGLAIARNWLVLRYGGLTRRPGTMFDNSAKNSTDFRFIEFIFNETQAYALEFGNLYIRFHAETGRVESPPGTPVEVVSPYLTADLDSISYAQSGDTIYLACRGYAPRKLVRSSETSWALSLHEPEDGPFLPVNATNTTLTPASYGSVTPVMTSNVLPSGTASGSAPSGGTAAWQALNKNKGDGYENTGTAGSLAYDFAGAGTEVADAYWITGNPDGDTSPITWTFEGLTGGVWVVLDTRTGESGWSGETRFYEFRNEIAYESYRIVWTSNNGNALVTRINELGIHERGQSQTAFNLTASSVTGINGNTGFQTTDVGRMIRLRGSDGVWRWAKIAARTSTTVVTIRLYTHALPDLDPIVQWALSSWSVYDDYPAAVSFYEDRLVWASTETRPLTLNFSRSSDYDHHGVDDPVLDDDGVSVTLSTGRLNTVQWMIETEQLILGTQGGIRIVGPNDESQAFSPSNVRQKGQTAVRAGAVQPILIDRTVLFVEKHLRKIYETAFTYEANGYVAYELTVLAEHLFWGQIRFMCYQDAPYNTLWVGCEDGTLVACTYDREQKVFGVSPVDTDGEVITGVVIPGEFYDVPMFGIRRTINGTPLVFIERSLEPYREGKSSYDIPMYFDCADRYQGAATNSLTGITHLEGETVGIYADGVDIGDGVVTAGVLTLPFEIEAEDILFGLRITSTARTLRLSQLGNRDGTAFGRKARIVGAGVDLFETYGMEGGAVGEREVLRSEDDHANEPDVPALYTGFLTLHTEDTWTNGGVFEFETDRNYPATIRALRLEVEGEP